MPKLAINGGAKVRNIKFPAYRVIGEKEEEAVLNVLRSGVLSRFIGGWHEDFYGGPQVKALEREWLDFYGTKHAIALNSATSALYAALGAIDIEPGDEVIVTPYSMSCSAVAPLIYGAIPVFADIEEDYFCLSAKSIEDNITEHTRAIIVVDLFGQPYDAEVINAIAKKYKLVVIEDCAQAPAVKYNRQWAGTLGDVGVYSLNYHKHIHSGEGGVVVTNNDYIADKVRMIRNHAESVIEGKNKTFTSKMLANMVGFNYRMTEMEASIARVQLKKVIPLVEERQKNVAYLAKKLSEIPCLQPAKIRLNCEHAFYKHVIKYKKELTRLHRDRFLEAVKAELMPTELRESEGVNINGGYVKPIYWQPLFQNKIAFGSSGFPWNYEKYKGNVHYDRGICPIVEKMHKDVLITHELMRPGMTTSDLNDVADAFYKVWEYQDELL